MTMKYESLIKEIAEWKEENIITQEQFEILKNRYKKEEKSPRLYTKLSKNKFGMFFLAFIVIMGSIAWLSNLVPALNDIVVFVSLFVVAFGVMLLGDYIEDRNLSVIKFVGKCIMIFGCLLFTGIFFYLDYRMSKNFNMSTFGNDWATFMLISSIITALIGYFFREKEIIGYSIVLSTIWFISEGKIATGEYFGKWLGVTFATRLIIFSFLFIGLWYLHRNRYKVFQKYKFFANTYKVFGLLIMFISAFEASIGNWLNGSVIGLRLQTLIYVIFAISIAIYSIYYGIIKSRSLYINLGMLFFSIIAFGNVYKIFSGNLTNPLFYILIVIFGILIAVVTEYVLTHKKELKAELIKSKN